VGKIRQRADGPPRMMPSSLSQVNPDVNITAPALFADVNGKGANQRHSRRLRTSTVIVCWSARELIRKIGFKLEAIQPRR
jgi:hypothetical protein